MRISTRLGLGISLALATVLSACAGESPPRITSGQYEQLVLAVDPKGRLTGYFREEQGRGVVKSCVFSVSGQGKEGEFPIVSWSDRAFPGTLKANKSGVTLKIPKGREHPGCGLVLLPQIADGLEFDRVSAANWYEFRKISSARAQFYSAPDPSRVQRAYVVSGDVVGVVASSGKWLEVDYQGKQASIKGWILASDTVPLTPPE